MLDRVRLTRYKKQVMTERPVFFYYSEVDINLDGLLLITERQAAEFIRSGVRENSEKKFNPA